MKRQYWWVLFLILGSVLRAGGVCASINISFVSPTLPNNSVVDNTTMEINISINSSETITDLDFEFNGHNFSFINDSLKLRISFDNISALGESNSLVADHSNFNNSIRQYGDVVFENAVYGQGKYFDGDDDYLNVTDSDALDISSEFTIAFWAKQYEFNANARLLEKYVSAVDGRAYRFETGGTTSIAMYLSSNGEDYNTESANCFVTANNVWTHVAITFNTGQLYYYRNGEYCDEDTTSNITELYQSSRNIFIGSSYASTLEFNGSLDEIIIYNKSLSSTDIEYLYKSTVQRFQNDSYVMYYNDSSVHYGNYTIEGFANTQDSTGELELIYRDYNSDYLGLGNGASILFVDNNNGLCNNNYTRTEATNGWSPWCSLSENVDKVQAGDTIYFMNGTYNGRIYFNKKNYNDDIIISAYPSEEVNITNYQSDFVWVNATDGTDYYWYTDITGLVSDYVIVSYDNNTRFISDKDWSWFRNAFVSRDYERAIASNANDTVWLRVYDSSFNPNDVNLYVSNAYGAIRMDDNNGAGKFKIYNLSFYKTRMPIYIQNSSNIIVDGCNFSGYHTAIRLEDGHGVVQNYTIKNNRFNDRIQTTRWYNDEVKNAQEEGKGVYLYDVKSNVNLHDNFFNNTGGLAVVNSEHYLANDSYIYNNEIWNAFQSALEIQYHCFNTTYHHNEVYDSLFGVSFGPAEGKEEGICRFHHNIVILRESYDYNETSTNWHPYAIKSYRLDLSDGRNVTWWNVNHNTFISYYRVFYGLYNAERTEDHKNSTWEDNIFYATGDEALYRTGQPNMSVLFDYNLYYHPNGDFAIRWSNDFDTTSHATLADAKAGGYWDGVWDVNSIDEQDPLLYNITLYNASPYSNSPVCGAASDGGDIGALPCLAATSTSSGLDVIIDDSLYSLQTFSGFLATIALVSIVMIILIPLIGSLLGGRDVDLYVLFKIGFILLASIIIIIVGSRVLQVWN